MGQKPTADLSARGVGHASQWAGTQQESRILSSNLMPNGASEVAQKLLLLSPGLPNSKPEAIRALPSAPSLPAAIFGTFLSSLSNCIIADTLDFLDSKPYR